MGNASLQSMEFSSQKNRDASDRPPTCAEGLEQFVAKSKEAPPANCWIDSISASVAAGRKKKPPQACPRLEQCAKAYLLTEQQGPASHSVARRQQVIGACPARRDQAVAPKVTVLSSIVHTHPDLSIDRAADAQCLQAQGSRVSGLPAGLGLSALAPHDDEDPEGCARIMQGT